MKLCDLVTYGDSLETVIHNLKVSLWQEASRHNGYTTEYGNSYQQLLEWLEELKTRRETIQMKQDSALLNQLCDQDKELIRNLYEALKDLESDIAEDVLISDYYDQAMRNIIELVTELKNKTEGKTK
jgi:predicted RNase H-like nuclease (RuvC/YqgF family)